MNHPIHELPEEELNLLRELGNAVTADEAPPASYSRARRALLERLPSESPTGSWFGFGSTPAARFAIPVAILAVAAAVVLNPFGGRTGQAFAAVVESLQDAATIAFSADWFFEGNAQPTTVEVAFRKPGLQRIVNTYQGAEVVQINDTEQDRGIVLIPATHGYAELDLTQMPSTERERLDLFRLITEGLASLPAKAEEDLGETIIDGRSVHGYRVGHRTLWIDEGLPELVRMELEMGGSQMIMRGFRLDPPELDDRSFSILPPADYTPVTDQAITFDLTDAGEADLIEFLHFMAACRTDARFPSMVNPMEILTLQERGLLREDQAQSLQEEQANGRAFAQASQRAVFFTMSMQPDNQWHYAGDGVVLGTPGTPIAWWKPDTAGDAYRVLWADLTVSDEAAWPPPPPAN